MRMIRLTCSADYILILTLVWSACGRCAEPTLEQRLAPLAKAHHGKVAIAVKYLDGGPSYFFNADQPMPAAGLIQLPILVEVYQQAAEGNVKLTDRLSLQDADKVPGGGNLAEHFRGACAHKKPDRATTLNPASVS
jgi:beta-lactamase class A